MEEAEVLEILVDLEQILIDLGYVSVVEQERRAAAAGRVIETTREDRARSAKGGIPRPEVGDVRRAPLSARERLSMLIDLVDVAVGATYAIEERVLNFAQSDFPMVEGQERLPTFRPDFAEGFEVEDERIWSLSSREMLVSRRDAVRQVLIDLQELRDSADVSRNVVLEADREHEDQVADRTLGWA